LTIPAARGESVPAPGDRVAAYNEAVATSLPQTFSHYPAAPPPVKVRLTTVGGQPCSYLPGRLSTTRAAWADKIPGSLYHRFMEAGFRRSGKLLYQPACHGCRACQSIRVPVANFRPSKSQRRRRRRNQDLVVGVHEPLATDEKFDLYRRYLAGRFERDDAGDDRRDAFEQFLYDSPVETLEFCYRDRGGKLLAVGICDVCAESLSSVYFYYDPAESRRGLGTFGALYEIEAAARSGIPYYYLGYWVSGCAAMEYKADFRPNEVLCPDGVWRLAEPAAPEGHVGVSVGADQEK
jgi:arginine-tRNA-protein transferase